MAGILGKEQNCVYVTVPPKCCTSTEFDDVDDDFLKSKFLALMAAKGKHYRASPTHVSKKNAVLRICSSSRKG